MNGRVLYALPLAFALLAYGCKTQEQIRREQMLDSVAHQVGQGQKLSAETMLRIKDMETRLAQLSGQYEELKHENEQVWREELNKVRAEVRALDEANKARDKEVEELRTSMQEQRKYLDQVVASLSQLTTSAKKPTAPASDEKGKKLSDFDRAMAEFDGNNFGEARPLMVKLLNGKKVNGNNRAKLLHSLGMMEYLDKNYDGALVYFSRLFTEHPGSSLNSSGLLHLGLAFKNLKKTEEAKQTFHELISRYPKTKHATTARGVLNKMSGDNRP